MAQDKEVTGYPPKRARTNPLPRYIAVGVALVVLAVAGAGMRNRRSASVTSAPAPVKSSGSDTEVTRELIQDQTPLAAGASYTISRNVVIPSTATGSRFLLFVTDAFDYQGEADESNNGMQRARAVMNRRMMGRHRNIEACGLRRASSSGRSPQRSRCRPSPAGPAPTIARTPGPPRGLPARLCHHRHPSPRPPSPRPRPMLAHASSCSATV